MIYRGTPSSPARSGPPNDKQLEAKNDKQTEVDNNILSVLLTPSTSSPSLPATKSPTQSITTIVENNSKPSLLSLIAKYQKKRNVLNRKINNNIEDDAPNLKSQLQKIDPRLIIDDNISTPFVNVKNLLREWLPSTTTCKTTKSNHATKVLNKISRKCRKVMLPLSDRKEFLLRADDFTPFVFNDASLTNLPARVSEDQNSVTHEPPYKCQKIN